MPVGKLELNSFRRLTWAWIGDYLTPNHSKTADNRAIVISITLKMFAVGSLGTLRSNDVEATPRTSKKNTFN